MTRTIAERALDAECRAVTEAHRAIVQPDGSVRVVSDTDSSRHYTVTFDVRYGGAVYFSCTCPAGRNRPELVCPCKHSALAGRRLEREGLAVWRWGSWWSLVEPEPEVDDTSDPFAGLPGERR